MDKKIFVLILSIITCHVVAQDQNIIDSLLIELKKTPISGKADILLEISKNYYKDDPALALDYAFDALNQARLNNDADKIGEAFYVISSTNSTIPDFDKAIIYIDSAIHLSETSKNEIFKAKCLNKKGIIFYKQSDFQQALYYFSSAVNFGDSIIIAQCYSNIGSTYLKLGNNNIASDYYYKALRINEGNNFTEGIADVCLNLANVYMALGEYVSALDFQLKSLQYFMENGYEAETGYCLSNINPYDINKYLYFLPKNQELQAQIRNLENRKAKTGIGANKKGTGK